MIKGGESILFDDSDTAGNSMRDDANELECMRKDSSVLDEIVFDVTDVFALLGRLDNKIH